MREELGIEPGRRALLYTPTHREYQEATCRCSTWRALADGLGEDWLVLARAHYFYESDEQMRELHRAGQAARRVRASVDRGADAWPRTCS